MGVTILNALFLVDGWRRGASYGSVLTLGRLDCFMTGGDFARVVRLVPGNSRFAEAVRAGNDQPSIGDLFMAMGASSVHAMDASDFEGAEIIHDLNEPLAKEYRSQYDVVVDGGTLEHVFNVPQACKNVMAALKVGGHFFGTLPANNWCGHGFYQFGPDFFFRVFSAENGFEIVKLLVAPAYVAGKWMDGPVFEVADPGIVRGRVEIKSRTETVFLVQARKLRDVSVFSRWPQQSDYAAAWSDDAVAEPDRLPSAGSVTTAWRRVVGMLGGVGRVARRFAERTLWRRQSRQNAALRPYQWTARPVPETRQ